ncbi:MAG: PrsW family glutamic-type intramembrane protease [Candidatus Caenarcaniphilales bacterium]|nr:PrsW family glutamic-type intramembrane protease [Candidatus Caenarcaniphilales bacterium]
MDFLKSIFLLLVATIPGFIYIAILRGGTPRYISDKLILFGLVAGIMAGLMILVSKFFFLQDLLQAPGGEVLTVTLFVSFIEAGLLEELVKNLSYLGLINLLGQNQKLSPFDLFALGGLVGLGFGVFENGYYALTPEYAKLTILLDRLYSAIPAHMIMNFTFGYLRARKVSIWLALLVSILIHAIYDFFALPSTLLGTILTKLVLVIGLGFVLWMGKQLWEESQSATSSPKL